MNEDQAVIIRDEAGTEHEFPAGFDPKRAAAIVRQQTAPAADPIPPRGAQPVGSHEMSDGPAQPPSPLLEMLGPLAHPQTLTDFARLLTQPVDSVKKALAGALSLSAARSSGGDAMTAAKNLASRVRVDPAAALEGFSLTKPQGALKGLSLAPKTPEMMTPEYERFLPNKSGYVAPAAAETTPAPIPAIAAEPMATPAAAAPTEFQAAQAARANTLPDQKALNEAALAARRAAYQASQSPAADEVVKASGKLHFTAPEWAAFRELRARGVGLEEAATGARAAGQLARQFGLSAPTLEQTQFPKGARGPR